MAQVAGRVADVVSHAARYGARGVSEEGRVNISQRGIDAIKGFEGCVLHVYLDQVGKQTIGVGHLVTDADRFAGRFTNGITEEQAEQLLRADLRWVEAGIADEVHVPLTQSQHDALCSLLFNVGLGPLRGTLGRLLNAGDYAGAGEQFKVWNKATNPVTEKLEVLQVLVDRRARELALWNTTDA